MGNLDLIKTSLQKYLGEDKIKKIATNRYLINSNIVFNSTFDFLPINLVEVNGVVYFADYGEIFKTYSGGTPLKSHPEFYLNGNIPWLQSGEINKKYIFSTEKYITDVGLRNSSAKYYPVNTVLVAMYGATAGQVGILKTEATSNQAICGILPDNQFMPEFVYYWFLNIQKKLVALARGGAQPNISQVKIKSMPIPVVPLSVQHDIVDKLNSIETNILKLEDNYNKITSELLLLKQSILREIFD